MRVLITGATGYVGRALTQYLLQRNYLLEAMVRSFSSDLAIKQHVIDFNRGVDDHLFSNIDVVICLAAKAHHVGKQTSEVESDYYQTNVETTLRVAQAASGKVKRFIYLSSVKVNGESTDKPFKIDDAPSPQDAYGKSKWEAEEKLHDLFSASTTELVVIRPPLVWGDKVKGNLLTLVKLMNWRIPLPFRSLNNRRDVVSLENLCRLIEVCMTHPNASAKTFFVSDGVARSTHEIALLIAGQSQFRPVFIDCPAWVFKLLIKAPLIGLKFEKIIGNLEVDISDTREILGWEPIRYEAKRSDIEGNT